MTLGRLPADAPKAYALPVFDPERRGDRLGVPRVEAPFGIYHARCARKDAPDSHTVIVEGEMDAIAELMTGPAVATGGTGRMGGSRSLSALRAAVADMDPIVCFDADGDPQKQKNTDQRAHDLALAIGCRWLPARRFAHAIDEVSSAERLRRSA